jgi:hypothetical protein
LISHFNYDLFYKVLALYAEQGRPDEHIQRLYHICHPHCFRFKRAYVGERTIEL